MLEGVETACLRPQSYEEISNRWGVAANSTRGRAPPSVRRLYLGLQCSSSPSSCQQLSDFYGLSPQLSLDSAARVPGSMRDLWLLQQCTTSPVGHWGWRSTAPNRSTSRSSGAAPCGAGPTALTVLTC